MTRTVVFDDLCTDTDGTLLTAHTPTDAGLNWTFLAGGDSNADINTNAIAQPFYASNDRSFYTAEVTQTPSEEQWVTVICGPTGNPRQFLGPCLRLQSDTTLAKGYYLDINTGGTNRIQLYRIDAGVRVLVDSITGVTTNANSVVEWHVTASGDHDVILDTVQLTWNGTGTSTVNDNTHTGGKIGLSTLKTLDSPTIDRFTGEYDVTGGGTPISFTGNIANQNYTINTAIPTLDISTEFTGDILPLQYEIQSGVLPDGLTLNINTGEINGTPTTAGTQSGIVVRCTDNNANTADSNAFSITIEQPIQFTGNIADQSYELNQAIPTLDVSGEFTGNINPRSYALVAGTLPTGLSLNTNTGEITGTPTVEETQTGLVIRCTDDDLNTADSNAFQIEITQVVAIQFDTNISDLMFPVDVAITPIDLSTNWSGTETPFSFVEVVGTLPAGLSLSSAGVLSGTPTADETQSGIVIRGTDQDLNTADSNAFEIVIDATAWGELGSNIPSTGTDGPALAYPSLSLPADNNNRYRIEVVTPPASGTLTINFDTSATFDREGGPDGDYVAVLRLFENDVALVPDFNATFTFSTPASSGSTLSSNLIQSDLATVDVQNISNTQISEIQGDGCTVSVLPITSTITINVAGVPDGVYQANFCDATTGVQIERISVTALAGTITGTLQVLAGTDVRGYIDDTGAPPPDPVDGAYLVGTTT